MSAKGFNPLLCCISGERSERPCKDKDLPLQPSSLVCMEGREDHSRILQPLNLSPVIPLAEEFNDTLCDLRTDGLYCLQVIFSGRHHPLDTAKPACQDLACLFTDVPDPQCIYHP